MAFERSCQSADQSSESNGKRPVELAGTAVATSLNAIDLPSSIYKGAVRKVRSFEQYGEFLDSMPE